MLAALLLAQGAGPPLAHRSVVGWLVADRRRSSWRRSRRISRRRSRKNPALALDIVRPRRLQPHLPAVRRRDASTDAPASNRPNGLPAGYVRAMQQRVRRGGTLNDGRPARWRARAGRRPRRWPAARRWARRRAAARRQARAAGREIAAVADRAIAAAAVRRADRRARPSSSAARDRVRRHPDQPAAGVRRDSRARPDADAGSAWCCWRSARRARRS